MIVYWLNKAVVEPGVCFKKNIGLDPLCYKR